MFEYLSSYRRVSKEKKISVDRKVRRFLPRSLLARTLLMISIPLFITQAISLELFYGTFLSTVSRRLADSVSSEISFVVQQFTMIESEQQRSALLDQSQQYLQLNMKWFPNQNIQKSTGRNSSIIGPVDELLDKGLEDRLNVPYKTDWHSYDDQVIVLVQLKRGMLEFIVPQKKLTAGSVWLFIVWIVGSAIILFLVTAVFAWIQFRAIRRLSKSVEKFGKGMDPGILHPVGSKELRNAAEAFNLMRERILRFVKQRTVILASVSHDLRTPLTRLRLSLAMLPQKGVINAEDQAVDIAEMITDIEEMEQMISGYLSFARGEGTEEPRITDMVQLSEDVVAAAYRLGTVFISVDIPAILPDMTIRVGSIRRVLGNVMENARHHGGQVNFIVQEKDKGILFTIDDDGPGIPKEKRESVFVPFETSNSQKGTGLGLTIARNIIQGHGGDIELQNSPLGGLRVSIYIPK